MKQAISCLLCSVISMASAGAALVERDVVYEQDGTELEGFHVYDDAVEGKRPAVLVIHQWMGLNDNEKRRSRMLAELGYNVVAADIYGKGVRPGSQGEAGKQAGKFKGDRKLYRARLLAGREVLKSDERSDPAKMAATGYCFGGTGVLELARCDAPLSGVVSFHGGLDAAEDFTAVPAAVSAKVLALHGAADPYVPAEQVMAFEKEMTDAGADRRSWQAMKVFFSELFGS